MALRHIASLASVVLCGLLVGCAPPEVVDPPAPKTIVKFPDVNALWVDPKNEPDEKRIFSTLAKAIAAGDKKIIHLAPGEYKESLVIPKGAEITLVSDAKSPAVLKPPDGKPGIQVEEGATLHLRYFTLEGGQRGIVLAKGSALFGSHVVLKGMVGQAIFGDQAHVQLSDTQIMDLVKTPQPLFKELGNAMGIRLNASALKLHQCSFSKTQERGVLLLNGSSLYAYKSTFTNKEPGAIAAISMQKGGTGHVQDAKITGWKEAIFVQETSITLKSIQVDEARGNAIFIAQESWVLLDGATINAAGKSGISFSLSGGVVRNATINKAGEYGIFVVQGTEQRQLLLENNVLNDNKAAGIGINNAHVIAKNNKISRSQRGTVAAGDDGYGIQVLNAEDVTLEQNQIEDCVGTGILFSRSTGRIIGNIVKGNKEGGILLTNANLSPTVQVSDNELSKNTIAGIFLLSSVAALSGNKVRETIFSPSDQSGTGVVLFASSKATLSNETYEKNEQHGLLLAQRSEATVKSSKFLGNKQYGIQISCADSKLTEEGNQYSGNALGDKTKCQ